MEGIEVIAVVAKFIDELVGSTNDRKLKETEMKCNTEKEISHEKCSTAVKIAGILGTTIAATGYIFSLNKIGVKENRR